MMINKTLILVFGLLLPVGFILGAVTQSGSGSNVTATIKPNDPKPGEFVEITIGGYGFDTNNTYFEWTKNGKQSKTGVGDNVYSFQLGQVGEATRVGVVVIANRRKLAEKSFYFEPSEIQFSWEASSFVPSTYLGRPRASAGSEIKIVATPRIADQSGKIEKVNELNYLWYKNDTQSSELSGKGKNIVKIKTDTEDSQLKITLVASNQSGKNSAKETLIINLGQPEIGFYEDRPLSGPNFQKQISTTYDLYEPETSFLVVPFFWPIPDNRDIKFTWRVNNSLAESGDKSEILTVRQPESGSGQNQISAQLETGERKVQGRFNIKFGNNLLRFNNADI